MRQLRVPDESPQLDGDPSEDAHQQSSISTAGATESWSKANDLITEESGQQTNQKSPGRGGRFVRPSKADVGSERKRQQQALATAKENKQSERNAENATYPAHCQNEPLNDFDFRQKLSCQSE